MIIAYRRYSNLRQLLALCWEVGVSRIYVHIDGPASAAANQDSDRCIEALDDFNNQHPGVLRRRIAPHNLGPAVAVITSCNWVFESEEFVVVLEDDCLPSSSFFKFVAEARRHLDRSSNIYAISGSQLAPVDIVGKTWCLSSYFLIWGWATSRVKWQEMFQEILDLDLKKVKRNSLGLSEFLYWKAGARRAIQGFVDTWDIPLMLMFRTSDRQVIVPNQNLVTNLGDDKVATHTSSGSEWIRIPSFTYKSAEGTPEENRKLDSWLRTKVFKISCRHLITTRLTLIRDWLGLSRRIRTPLLSRLIDIQ